jgi:hypothetical protein
LKKRFLVKICSLIILTLFLSVLVSHKVQEQYGGVHQEEKLLYIPSGKYLDPAVMGYNQFAADILWLKALSYFGSHALSDRVYTWLPNLLEAVTTLDPFWEFPFHFAGVVLSVEGKLLDEANRIVKKGMEFHPNTWQLPFYVGFNFFHEKNNPVCGAKYIFQASSYPKAPAYLKPLAARLSNKGNSRENHILMCQKLLSLTKDEDLRKQIIKNCNEKLKKEEFSNIEKLKEACP